MNLVLEPIEILMVEDNPGDVRLTQEALREGKVINRLGVVRDGEDAMDCLYKRGKFASAIRPGLILLDLNLPRKDGRQVLHEIREDPALADIPVVVLTASKADEDILRSSELRVNAYLTKPVDFAEFIRVVRSIDGLRFIVAIAPAA